MADTSPDNANNLYVFQRAVTHKDADGSTSTGFIDLYKSQVRLPAIRNQTGHFFQSRQGGHPSRLHS